MALLAQHGTPSTLPAVIRQVRAAFDAMGDATPILIGEHYLKRGVGDGATPRIVFVPFATPGKWGPASEMGLAASINGTCDVYVRAPTHTDDDITVWDDALSLAAKVMATIVPATSGRLEPGAFADDTPEDTESYGVELKFSFSFVHDVSHSAARWSLPAASEDPSNPNDPQPGVPPGQSGTVDTVDLTVEPVEDD